MEEEVKSKPTKKKCPTCGKFSPADSKFCQHCGGSMTAEKEKKVNCPSCGKLTSADSKFCQHCGGSMSASQSGNQAPCPHCGEMTSINDTFCEKCESFLGKEWTNPVKAAPTQRTFYNKPTTSSSTPKKHCFSCRNLIPVHTSVCPHCGKHADPIEPQQPTYQQYQQDKTGMGVLMALLLGLIGLIIGLCIYNDYERETFLSGWIKTFVITLIASVVILLLFFGCSAAAIGSSY